MKKIALILFLIFTALATNAQSSEEEIDYIQALFGMEKRAAVKEFLIFDSLWRPILYT